MPAWLGFEPQHRNVRDVESLIGVGLRNRHGLENALREHDAGDTVGSRDRVVVIDDSHWLDQVLVDELLEWFRSLPGDRWQLILAGRATFNPPRRPAPHLMVRSIGPAELRLDDDVVEGALRRRLPGLPSHTLSHLTRKIDGWAGGIDLVCQAMDDRRGCDSGSELPTGSHLRISDYLEQEVLSGLPRSDQEFLIWCAVLSEPSADLCDQLIGGNGSADRLVRLGNSNAFLLPKSGRDGYRWVPFGREFLLGRLGEVDRDYELEARRRILHFCLETKRYDEAVTQAVESQDWNSIVDLVLHAGLEVIGDGRGADLVAWIERLPTEIAAAESGVAVLAAMALWVENGDDASVDIERWLVAASTAQSGRPPDDAHSLSGSIDTARAAFGQLEPRQRRILAQRAIESEPGPETAWTALSWTAAGIAAYLDDDLRAARHALTESLRIQSHLDAETRRIVSRLFSPAILAVLALIEIEGKGYADRANALISIAELQSPRIAPTALGASIVRLAKIRAAMAAGDRDTALELSLDADARGQAHSRTFHALGFLDAASIHCERGQSEESSACLAAADRLMNGSEGGGRLLAKRKRAIERQVHLGQAARWDGTESLTERESEVLQLLDSNLSRREIAQQLYLSFETVKTYVQRLYQKLGVSSRSAAVATARSWGWLDGVDLADPSS